MVEKSGRSARRTLEGKEGESMTAFWRAALLVTAILFAIHLAIADEKKDASKSKKEETPASATAKQPPSDPPADSGTDPAANPAPTTTEASPAPAPAPGGKDTWQEGPRWIPMPALDGNPGLFTLETGELIPKGGFDASVGVNKISRMPGSTTILQVVPSFGVGITNWLSFFFQIDAHDHIHVDTPSQLSLSPLIGGNPSNPQYLNTIYRSLLPGTGIPPGYVEDYPFAGSNGGGIGEMDFGFKIGLLSERRGKPLSLSIRNDFYIPTKTDYTDLLANQVQYGTFNYGIGLEASKSILHHAILATLNWSFRFTRQESFNAAVGGVTPIQVLKLSDQMGVGFGMLIWPDKRFQIISEYDGLIYIGKGIQNTTFGARDPVDSVTGVRIYPWRFLALDIGYRYNLNLSSHLDRNGFIVKLSGGYWPEKTREPDSLTSSCSADKSTVMEGSGEIVQATANATDAWGHPLTYTWTSTGGRFDGAGPYVRWDSTGASAGTYALTARVSDGAGNTSSCSANVTVKAKPIPQPRMSCSTDRSTVLVGERAQITADVNDPSGAPLKYSWQSNGGQIVGSGPSVQLDTSGLSPGAYNVTGRVENGAGGAADCSVPVSVQAPAPPPQASKIAECTFGLASARANNVCKRALDDVAVRLETDPKGRVVLVGSADAKEKNSSKLAGERADAAKKFLDSKKGVDATRIETRSTAGTSTEAGQNRRLDVIWVPEGATY
jgi:outer membrane protein OmpA-like peptidoglycan-associated protein